MGYQISFLHQELNPLVPLRPLALFVSFLIQISFLLDALLDMLDFIYQAALNSGFVGRIPQQLQPAIENVLLDLGQD